MDSFYTFLHHSSDYNVELKNTVFRYNATNFSPQPRKSSELKSLRENERLDRNRVLKVMINFDLWQDLKRRQLPSLSLVFFDKYIQISEYFLDLN